MPLIYEKPAVSLAQKRAALLIAGIADFIQLPGMFAFGEGFLSIPEDVLDVLVALLLMGICGFRWQWILAFGTELIPGLDLFPTWTMVVALLETHESRAAKQYPLVDVEEVEAYYEGEEQGMEVYDAGVSAAGGEVSQQAAPTAQLPRSTGGVVVPPVRAKGV